ncbi:MAG: PH domain-containing protein [Acidobacteriota bacterium]
MADPIINDIEDQESENPAPLAAAPSSIADGIERSLDPRHIQLDRIVGAVTTAIVAVSLSISWLILLFVSSLSLTTLLLMLAGVGAFILFLAWFTQVWPGIEHRHCAYRVDQLGIEIRRGVFWREVITVPRSRVQHTDVSQGPLERRFGLAKLHIFTAGTQHSKVELPGLARATAREIRDHLMVGGEDDAV